MELLHPKVVHIPLALAVLMPLIAGGLWLAWWRGLLPRRAWWVAALLQATLVVGGFVGMKTGENDEERVERVVPEAAIHEHEEAGEVFTWTAAGVLLLFGAALFLRRESLARGVALAATAGSIVVLALGVRAGDKGGDLVYEHGAARAYMGETGAPAPPPADDGD